MFKNKICQNISDTYIVMHILACFIGIASWVDMSGLWLQLPIFVTTLPEKWTLSSYVVLIQQAANLGPIIFAVCVCMFPRKHVEQPTSCLIIIIGIIACLLLSFFWDKTSVVGGTEHSTALFGLSFMLAFVDTTSSLAFLSFMAMLKPEYLPSYFVGEGLSSLLPALVAFGQGAGNINCVSIGFDASKMVNGTLKNVTVFRDVGIFAPPVFAVKYFFLILAWFLMLSLWSFILIICFPKCNICKSAYSNSVTNEKRTSSYSLEKTAIDKAGMKIEAIAFRILQNCPDRKVANRKINDVCSKTAPATKTDLEEEFAKNERKPVSIQTLIFLLVQTCWKGILFTVTISIQPYFSLPFGLKVYHLSNTLGTVALPVGCLVCLFLPMYSIAGVTVLTGLYTGLSAYFFYMAAMSPNPPLVDHEAGPPLLMVLCVILMLIWTYSEVAIAGILRPGGRKSMIWMGVSIQTGSVIGGITAYVMVNVYHLFQDASPC